MKKAHDLVLVTVSATAETCLQTLQRAKAPSRLRQSVDPTFYVKGVT